MNFLLLHTSVIWIDLWHHVNQLLDALFPGNIEISVKTDHILFSFFFVMWLEQSDSLSYIMEFYEIIFSVF